MKRRVPAPPRSEINGKEVASTRGTHGDTCECLTCLPPESNPYPGDAPVMPKAHQRVPYHPRSFRPSVEFRDQEIAEAIARHKRNTPLQQQLEELCAENPRNDVIAAVWAILRRVA